MEIQRTKVAETSGASAASPENQTRERMSGTRPSPVCPAAPTPPAKNLSTWRLLREIGRNFLAVWPDYTFDVLTSRSRLFGVESLTVHAPGGIRHVLATNAANYRRPVPQLRVLRPLAGNGVLLAAGSEWRRQRRMLAPLFIPKNISLLIPHFHYAADELVRQIGNAPFVNLSAAFQNATSNAVLTALFSLPADSRRTKLAAMLGSYITGPGRANVFDALARKENGFAFASRKRHRFQQDWFAAVDEVVAARRQVATSDQRNDLLDLLFAARDPETGAALTVMEIRDQCATMLTAGFETTSLLLFWATYLLTLDRAEQSRIREEIKAFPPERVTSLEDLANWPRLRRTLLETLRLYPSAPHIVREAIGADVVFGEEVRPGTQIWISLWVLHRHRKFWDNPAAFMPDRFNGKPLSWDADGAFLPFGGGPRICLGASFAMAEAQIILATLLSRYEIGLDDPRPVLPVANFTIFPSFEPNFALKPV